ncbi:DUF397 domain-containing protein [Nocardia sp. NPDC059764]|uniref:DUF397 domain-containing protein n=1 Tax=Nocardia sp. NPDC059764 TaxID=3346939 RepID=UPI00365E053F
MSISMRRAGGPDEFSCVAGGSDSTVFGVSDSRAGSWGVTLRGEGMNVMNRNVVRGERRGPRFAKSSFSYGGGDCVEVAFHEDQIAVRDSKDRHSPTLWFTKSEWRAFTSGVRAGEFDFGE